MILDCIKFIILFFVLFFFGKWLFFDSDDEFSYVGEGMKKLISAAVALAFSISIIFFHYTYFDKIYKKELYDVKLTKNDKLIFYESTSCGYKYLFEEDLSNVEIYFIESGINPYI